MIIHHIGIVVTDINKSIDIYNKIGFELEDNIVIDDVQKNRIAFLKSGYCLKLELIEPLDEESSVYNFREGYHHICYEAEQGEDIIQKFKKMKIGKIFTPPIISPALDNRKVVFACLQNGTFIELIL